jgi:hypothetical protein
MRSVYRLKWRSFLYFCVLGVTCVLVLAACGKQDGTVSSTGAAANPTATPVATATPTPGTSVGYGTTHGCPSDAVFKTAPTKATVLVQSPTDNQTVTAHIGDIIEVHFPFGFKWNGPTTTSGILELLQPSGYAWSADQSCVWRFAAKSSGSVDLNFDSRAICKAGQMCPMFIRNTSIVITVQ